MKTALITGGTKGIGKIVTLQLIRNDYFTFVVYSKDTNATEQLFEELTDKEKKLISFIKLDLSEATNIDLLVDKVKSLSGLDALILNAGKTNRKKFSDITINEWNEVLNFNCTIPLFIIQRLVPLMNKSASIIFTGSLMGIYPHSVSLSYGVTKAAVHSMVKNLVKFLEPYEIRINVVAPGFVNTDWHKNKSVQMVEKINRKISLHRFADAEEVASTYMFILQNNYINGQEIIVDGGYCYE